MLFTLHVVLFRTYLLIFSLYRLPFAALRLQWKLADRALRDSSGSVHQRYEGDLEATSDRPDLGKVTSHSAEMKQDTPSAAATTGRN